MITEKNVVIIPTHARKFLHQVIERTYTGNGQSPYYTNSFLLKLDIGHPTSSKEEVQAIFNVSVRPNRNRFELWLSLYEKNGLNRHIKPYTKLLIDTVADFESAMSNYINPYSII